MASVFYKLGSSIIGTTGLSFKTQAKLCRQHFGINPHSTAVTHMRIKKELKMDVSKTYLLWSLYFLSWYPKVKTIRKVFGVDQKTYRKHTSQIIICIHLLKVVS